MFAEPFAVPDARDGRPGLDLGPGRDDAQRPDLDHRQGPRRLPPARPRRLPRPLPPVGPPGRSPTPSSGPPAGPERPAGRDRAGPDRLTHPGAAAYNRARNGTSAPENSWHRRAAFDALYSARLSAPRDRGRRAPSAARSPRGWPGTRPGSARALAGGTLARVPTPSFPPHSSGVRTDAQVVSEPGRPGPDRQPRLRRQVQQGRQRRRQGPDVLRHPRRHGEQDTSLTLSDIKEDVVVLVFLATTARSSWPTRTGSST